MSDRQLRKSVVITLTERDSEVLRRLLYYSGKIQHEWVKFNRKAVTRIERHIKICQNRLWRRFLRQYPEYTGWTLSDCGVESWYAYTYTWKKLPPVVIRLDEPEGEV